MLRKNPKSEANGRKPFSLIEVSKQPTLTEQDSTRRTSFLQFAWVDLELPV